MSKIVFACVCLGIFALCACADASLFDVFKTPMTEEEREKAVRIEEDARVQSRLKAEKEQAKAALKSGMMNITRDYIEEVSVYNYCKLLKAIHEYNRFVDQESNLRTHYNEQIKCDWNGPGNCVTHCEIVIAHSGF